MRCFGRTLVSFCHLCDETIKQIFLERMCVLTDDICLSILTPQTAIFGCINGIESNVYKITNHAFYFKLHVYKTTESGTLALNS